MFCYPTTLADPSFRTQIASAPKLVEGEILDETKLKEFLRI